MTTTRHALRLFPAAAGFCALALMLADPAAATPDATARLKEAGQYDSLMQAVQAARYSVETVPDGAATGPDAGCYAGNPAQSLRCWFRPDGLELQSAGTMTSAWKLNLRLRGYGRETLQAANVDGVSARQNRVELSRASGAVVEWYENKAAGLEQGFTVRSAPAGGAGPLRLLLEAEGDLRPELEAEPAPPHPRSGDSAERRHSAVLGEEMRRSPEAPLRQPGMEHASAVKFVTADGQAALRYSGLKVWDAAQRELAAHIEVRGRQLSLVVNDRDATYPVTIDPTFTRQAYLKASNTGSEDYFGWSIAISGNTVIVGAPGEDSNANTINGDQSNNSAQEAGAAYVFVRNGTTWSQQAYLKPSDNAAWAGFGWTVAASGETVAVGINSSTGAKGAVYVFVRNGSSWSQQARLEASNGAASDYFGQNQASVALSGDTLVVGADGEDSNATGVNGNQSNNSATDSGAAYVFVRQGTTWSQQAYLKASNTQAGDHFGASAAVSADTVVVGAWGEASNATGINGDQNNNSATYSGAAYVFVRDGSTWSQQAYIKASNTEADDSFGGTVAISGDTVVAGATGEDSIASGVGGNQSDNQIYSAGAAYVFVRDGTTWSQQAYLKSVFSSVQEYFGISIAVSGDTAVVGCAKTEMSYFFRRTGTTWAYVTAPSAAYTENNDQFGARVAVSGDTVLVSARYEDGSATGVNGTHDNNAGNSGAAYVFVIPRDTIVTLASSASPSTYGDSVTFTANVTPSAASGTVTFKDGATTLGTGSLSGGTATYSTSALSAGNHNITAEYAGDISYAASTSSVLIQTVKSLAASDATYARAPGLALKIRIADIVWDVNASPVTVQSLGASAQGATLSFNSTYIFYTPANNNNDSFTYTVQNSVGDTASATLTVNVVAAGGFARTITVSAGTATVKFFGIPGLQYDVQRTTSLAEPVTWATLTTGSPLTPDPDGSFTHTDASAPNGTAYYRSLQH